MEGSGSATPDRYIANSSRIVKFSASLLANLVSFNRYYAAVYERSRKTMFWSIQTSDEVLSKLNSRGFRATSLSTHDFSCLYATFPHYLIKDKLLDLI